MGRGAALRVLLLSAALAGAVERLCCDWAEVDEWPADAEGSQCPAMPDGGNVTICCRFCWLLEEEQLRRCQGEGEDKPAAASGAPAHDSLFPLLGLMAVILILFFCLWMCQKDRTCFHGEDAESFSGSTPAFAWNTYSRLRSRDPPLSYEACSPAAEQSWPATDPPMPQGLAPPT